MIADRMKESVEKYARFMHYDYLMKEEKKPDLGIRDIQLILPVCSGTKLRTVVSLDQSRTSDIASRAYVLQCKGKGTARAEGSAKTHVVTTPHKSASG